VLAGTGTARAARPVVWVQAGHQQPMEPGYTAQTGAGSGPFGSEVAFTTRLAAKVEADLRAAGVDARHTGGLVNPMGARGAVFLSLHHDAPGGFARVGHAVVGGGENYYHGEGYGPARQTPYPDSAPHRTPATTVSPQVAASSTALAQAVARRYARIFTPANGAGSHFGGVEPAGGEPRMMHYYGYYRTNAGARMLIECGAAGADDAFLARTDIIARAVSDGVVDYLRRRGQLPVASP
jgi:hypothetical protein